MNNRLKEIIKVIKDNHLINEFNPTNVCNALEELGPTFIKLGQLMSARNDIIGEEYCNEFKKLRSNVKPMDYEVVKSILDREYDGKTNEIFKSIDKDVLGSASIAEVHKAVLNTGEEVVLKIQRENIKQTMNADIKLLKNAIKILNLNKILGIFNLDSFLDEIYSSALEEMDFNIEVKHIEEFNSNNKDVNYLGFIKVYKEYSTEYVLVMDYIGGYRIDEITKLSNLGYDMNEISTKLAANYMKQAIDDGFYHADPHADNIKIDNGKIIYLDFGMMGRINSRDRTLLNNCIKYIIEDDIKGVDHIITLLNIGTADINHMKLSNDIRKVLDKNKMVEVSKIDIKSFINDMYSMLKSNNIVLPKDISMLMRGILVIAGLLEDISPNISLVDVLKERISLSSIINDKEIKNVLQNAYKSSKDLVEIPKELLTTLKGINDGELKFNVEFNNSNFEHNSIDIILHQAIITILDVAVILGMAIMATSKITAIFYIYAILSLIFTLWLFMTMSINKIKRK